jgi:hypothetical protein
MFFTYTSRTGINGIHAKAEHLSPLGITDDAQVWGLFIEGREIDERCRLDGSQLRRKGNQDRAGSQTEWLGRQSPHLAASPLHPSTWATAFTVQAMMQRHRPDDEHPTTVWDSCHGVCDALRRLGVNMLWIRTSQIGYDLVAFTATCEFPHLRIAAKPLIDKADEAGKRMAAARLHCAAPGMSRTRRDEYLKTASEAAERTRREQFSMLGKMMLPRLAELESRLIVMEEYRYQYDKAEPLRYEDRKHKYRAKVTKENILAKADSDYIYEAVVGIDPGAGIDRETRRARFKEAISHAWFFSNKVVEAGENTFFLGYNDFGTSESIRTSRMVVVGERALPAGCPELSERSLDRLHEATLDTLKKREVEGSLKGIFHESETAKRVRSIADGKAYEVYAMQDFFRRQALLPLRVTALPSLAHARFWAFASFDSAKGKIDQGPFEVQFKYRKGTLEAVNTSPRPEGKMSPIYEFLNRMTRLENIDRRQPKPGNVPLSASVLGRFGPNAAVICSVFGDDRFVRMRFCRQTVETGTYCTVRANYRVERTNPFDSVEDGPQRDQAGALFSPLGLVKHFTELMLAKGFRAEGVFNKITESTATVEKGYVELMLQVAVLGPKALKVQKDSLARKYVVSDIKAWTRFFPNTPAEPMGADMLEWMDAVGFTRRAEALNSQEADNDLIVERVGRAWGAQLAMRWQPYCRLSPLLCEFERGFAPPVR